jgi:hypothetical protein
MVHHPITGQNRLMTGTDLLNGVTGTVVSQLSETGQGIMCTKKDIGKYDMWYGVVYVVRHNDNFSFKSRSKDKTYK